MNAQTVPVGQDIRARRMAEAEAFRKQMAEHQTYVVRLLSSPGSGKTTLLQQTTKALGTKYRVGVLVGDVETNRDAERLAPFAPSVQITTGGACHLELPLIRKFLPQLGESSFDFLFIEDIGNLICPASHDLGEHLRAILLSTTEGDDKPGKYPKAFRTSDVVVISKTDLLPYVPFSVAAAIDDARKIQPSLDVVTLSATTQDGIDSWLELLESRRSQMLNCEPSQSARN